MGQIVVAVAAIALALFCRAEAAAYPVTAGRLPDLLGIVIVVLAVIAIANVAWERLRARPAVAQAGPASETPTDWRSLALGAGFLALVILYALSITRIGYLIATPLFLAIPLIVLRPIGLVPAVSTIVAVTAVIFGIFVWFLNLSIPLYPTL
ncbi:tripartite tricarboxylate transporter TctB family protein [Paracoccus sp. Ld10]|uniref:tripartite tricarboxylate transporter TctB family protein n=1 Tax=Paracoccus sp. Ld10 TaxID=649158 RepID=UPI00386C0D3F